MDIDKISLNPYWDKEYEKTITGPFDYLASNPGKSLRGTLIKAFNSFLQVDEKTVNGIENVIEMLHISSLMIDDIEDNAALRRGRPAVHKIFGIPQTINASNYMYFKAMSTLDSVLESSGTTSKGHEIFKVEMINLHRGQGLDLYWRDNLQCPTEQQYTAMVVNKTGGLFRLAVRLLILNSRNSETANIEKDLIEFANLLGLIYQIRDDYMNLNSESMTLNKGFCEDITEGKFSFPIIHSISHDIDNKELLNILKLHTEDIELKKYALRYMESTGSFEYTRKTVEKLHVKADEIILKIYSTYKGTTKSDNAESIKDRLFQVLNYVCTL